MSSTDRSTPADDRPKGDSTTGDGAMIEAYRCAWQREPGPDLDAFVAQNTGLSLGELAALIRIDLQARWLRHEPRPAEDYLQSYEQIAENAELAVDVIFAEYLARERAGEQPGVAEYQRRFPQFADVLAGQISLHSAIEESDEADEHPAASAPDSQGSELLDSEATSYQLLQLIGCGGMGVVYRATQPGLNRLVALKMVRAIDASNLELLARFRSEARVVAALDHPHIVKVYDYGEHDALPYLAMELVEGGSLADRLDGTPWQPRDAAILLSKLAGAVQYAHEHRIVHRDLKPANVLITSPVGPIDVKITDFGLAKFYAEETSSHTKSNAFFGTPSYMAPEQAKGRFQDVGPASDIYALGAILHELLTGRPPFRGGSPIETLQLLLSTELVPTQRLAPRMPRDLTTICDKCLRGDIERRYATADELRADLERFLAGEPIRARRIRNIERTWRWCRRNPSLAGALASVAFLLLSTAAVALWYSGRLSSELTKTRIANQAAQERLWDAYIAEVNARHGSQQVGQRFAALETVDRAAALLDAIGRSPQRELQLRNAVLSSVALPDLRPAQSVAPVPHGHYAFDLNMAADYYAISASDGTISLFRLSDGKQQTIISCAITSYFEPVLAPGAKLVAAVGPDETQIWSVDGSEPHLLWRAAGARNFTFDIDGRRAAYSDPAKGMRLVNALDGTELRAIGDGQAQSRFAFHPAKDLVAVCGPDTIQVIELDTGRTLIELPMLQERYKRITWHPDGEYIAAWATEGVVIWNASSGEKRLELPHRGVPNRLVFNRDGSLLVSQSLWDSRLLVWDVGSGRRLLDVSEFDPVACDLTRDGGIAFLSNHSGQVTVTQLEAGACHSLSQSLQTPLGWWYEVSVSPEGRIIAFSSQHGLELWDFQTSRRLVAWPIGPCWAQFDRQGRLTLGCSKGVYRLPRREETATPRDTAATDESSRFAAFVRFGPPQQLSGQVVPESLAVNESGDTLLVQGRNGWGITRPDNGSEIVPLQTKGDPRKGAVSNDNRYAALANWDSGGGSICDARSGERLADLAMGKHGVVKFSPDDRWLAATPDGVTVWETSQWRRGCELNAHGTTPTGLGIAFSPDSRVIAVGQTNGILKLYDPSTGNEWAQLSSRDLRVATTIAFSPQQQYLVTASTDEDSTAKVWDIVALRRELAARGLDLPADVLSVREQLPAFENELDVRLEDGALFDAGQAPNLRDTPSSLK